MWEWLTWAAPGMVVLGTALIAYQIGHSRGWKEGYETACVVTDANREYGTEGIV